MSQETMMAEEMKEVDHEEVWEEGAWVMGSAGSDELEAKTQETHHHHPTR